MREAIRGLADCLSHRKVGDILLMGRIGVVRSKKEGIMVDKDGACNDKQPIVYVWNELKFAEEEVVEYDEQTLTECARVRILKGKLDTLANTAMFVEVFFPWGSARGNLRKTDDGNYALTIKKAELRPFDVENVAWLEGNEITLGV